MLTGRRWAQVARLSREDLAVAILAVVLVPLARVAVRVLPLPTLLRVPEVRRARPSPAGKVERLVRVVDAVGRVHPLGSTCLHRALAAFWLLKVRGHAGAVVLGVARDEGLLESHAWVEVGDGELAFPESSRFARLWTHAPDEMTERSWRSR
jgi:hypothetical protein